MLAAAPSAMAATIDVTTASDDYGTTAGTCSLREAITAAQTDSTFDGCAAGSGADVINVPEGEYSLTRVGANENLNVTGDLDVLGTNALTIQPSTEVAKVSVNGVSTDRVFDQQGNNSLSIRNLHITQGYLDGVGEDGGGIRNSVGTLTLEGVTISNNSTKYQGGAIAVYGAVSILNSTISGNTANGNGGGLWIPGGATASVKSSTITRNSADEEGDDNGHGGGFADGGAGNISFTNVILAANLDKSPNPAGAAPDCYSGPFFFPRYVLSTQALGSGSCLVGFNPATNKLTGDALLGDLGDNGGQTPTHALLTGSPAIAAGGTAAPDLCPATDQTGRTRPAGACDIGAVQYVEPPPPEGKLLIETIKPAKKKVKRGKTIKIKVTILNSGDAIARSVKVCLKLKAKKSRKALMFKGKSCKSVGSMDPAARRKPVFKVMAKKKAKKQAFTIVSSVQATGLSKATRPFKVKVK